MSIENNYVNSVANFLVGNPEFAAHLADMKDRKVLIDPTDRDLSHEQLHRALDSYARCPNRDAAKVICENCFQTQDGYEDLQHQLRTKLGLN